MPGPEDRADESAHEDEGRSRSPAATAAEDEEFDETRVWFFAPRCPCEVSCSGLSWKKARAWDYSEEAVRERVMDHLQRSGKHFMSERDARHHAQRVTVLRSDQTDRVLPPPSFVPGRGRPLSSPSRRSRGPAASPSPRRGARRPVRSPSLDSRRRRVSPTPTDLTAPRSKAGAEQPPAQMVLAGEDMVHRAVVRALRGEDPAGSEAAIVLRAGQFAAIIDATGRAAAAARQAQRLSAAAASAFEAEASILEDVCDVLRSIRHESQGFQ